MRHGSLFSGIGGFDLAAQWHGGENVFQVEVDPFCNAVLEKNFPDTKRYGDIKEFDGRQYNGQLDILTGGFPCQPFSTIGRRQGKDDARYLFPQMLRVIREVQPRYVIAENVAGSIRTILDEVCGELENAGFAVWSFVIPAIALGAPHYRARVWIVAHAVSERCNLHATTSGKLFVNRVASGAAMPLWEDTPSIRTSFCGMADGLPDRAYRNKALGNAIVPQIAYLLFGAISEYDRQCNAGQGVNDLLASDFLK